MVIRPGFKAKNVKYYISFGADGSFLGFDAATEKPMCPDIGSAANGSNNCNIIAEKAEIIFNFPDKDGKLKRTRKHTFYIDTLKEAGESDSLLKIAADTLSDEENLAKIGEEFRKQKGKDDDFISIKVDGQPVESSTGYLEWWEEFRVSIKDEKKKPGEMRCFITGEMTEPLATVPPISGVVDEKGKNANRTLICFDKKEFTSYGLEQSANAAVSENAMTGVNMALESLLKKSMPLAGAKNVHWFSEKTEYDIIDALDMDFDFQLEDDGFDSDDLPENDESVQEDERKARKLYNFIFKGEKPYCPQNRYYMMSLSGNKGRIMIRSYDEGYYTDLYDSIIAWYDDLKLISKYGKGYCRFPKLWTVYSRLLKFSEEKMTSKISEEKKKRDISERISKELSGLSTKIIYSIFHNTPLPDTVAVKALAYIRSDMYSKSDYKKESDDEKKSDNPKYKNHNIDSVSCQILKVWLNRKYRNQKKEEFCIMDKLNEKSPSKAYQVGRLMAVYAALQRSALGDVGAGVIERYYTSACTSPALVMGKLSVMSQYHLSKLEKGAKVYYNKMFQEISLCIGTSIPNTFSLEEQSQFALGYYFQNAQIFSKTNKKDTEE
jgi:CRISPR-associated protein Csd1